MIDLNEINRDPWPSYPVNKDDLRNLLAENARMREALRPFSALAEYGVDIPLTRAGRIARALCEADGADPDTIVLGYARPYQLATCGQNKQLVILQAPLQPAWMHYLRDAENAIAVCEMFKEE